MVETLKQDIVIRRELRPGDAQRIIDLHDHTYTTEYGFDDQSGAWVRRDVEHALAQGWPERAGGVWLIERDGDLVGSLALTPAARDGVGAVHWFVLTPELRGRGLGRSLMAELMAEARAADLRMLELETFSKLTTAAQIYRNAGFRVVAEEQDDKWGPLLTFQRYELDLD